MAKRRAVNGDSDSEDNHSDPSPASKRARTEDNEDNEVAPKRSKHSAKGKARQIDDKAQQEGDEEDDNEVEQITPDEDEEKRFEEEHEEEIRDLLKRTKVQGGIAEMGIIESLEMHQFMCHKYLTFNFGPQINFIIGHNGSGKSAVLSALTVALGGKATSTGRGNGLKAFIREGQGASEVTVTIKNQGEEAYKPNEYGKSIVITRKFSKEGLSSYKIKSKDGKVISTKREELSAICDHMNIQVDNPMNILTQDAARQFLSASQPADKYQLFLRGTQLSQLSHEYSVCMENVSHTQKVLVRKSEAIPELELALDDAKQRFKEANRAREQQNKVNSLKMELAWAHVGTKEEELTAKIEDAAKLSRRLPKIQEEVRKATEKFQTATEAVEKYEQELQELGEIEHLQERKKDLQEQMRTNKAKIAEYKDDERAMNQSLQATTRTIAGLDDRITAEAARLEAFSQGKREETNRNLDAAKADVERAEAQLSMTQTQRREKLAEAEAIKTQGVQLQLECDTAKKRMHECEQQLQNISEREQTKLAPFGHKMDEVLREITKMQWYGQPPVGPFGIYVQVKDPQRWAPLLRVQLGSLMSSFAITDARDRKALYDLLQSRGNKSPTIIVAEADMFDYSRGEPPANFLTVLRALEVSNPYVLRVLINSQHIENTFLAETRAEADQIMQGIRGGGIAWSGDYYRVQRFAEGGGQSNLLHQITNRGDARHLLFTSDDMSEAKRRWQQERQETETRFKETQKIIQQMQQTHRQLSYEANSLETQEHQIWTRLKQLKRTRDTLQEEANEELPVGVQSLQSHKQEAEAEKASILRQFKDLQEAKKKYDDAQIPLLTELDKIRKEIDQFEGRRLAIARFIEDAVQERIVAQNDRAHFEKKLAEEQRKVDSAEAIAKDLQSEFEEWTAKALAYCPRVENPRKPDEVERQLQSLASALKLRAQADGATVEQMTIEVNKRVAALESARKELKTMMSLNKSLRRSVRTRLAKWHEFRRHIALRCKVYFSYHLSNRGYYGKVLFDHVHGLLSLKVQTDDQMGTQTNSREKDPRSLSGGEKSFSTICLLLSLWESIGCPIRCLDEFDVFMDAVNRRISMRMMIDTANASSGRQYILITPQDMNNITIGNTVRVHRMTDPERGQGTLAFQ